MLGHRRDDITRGNKQSYCFLRNHFEQRTLNYSFHFFPQRCSFFPCSLAEIFVWWDVASSRAISRERKSVYKWLRREGLELTIKSLFHVELSPSMFISMLDCKFYSSSADLLRNLRKSRLERLGILSTGKCHEIYSKQGKGRIEKNYWIKRMKIVCSCWASFQGNNRENRKTHFTNSLIKISFFFR